MISQVATAISPRDVFWVHIDGTNKSVPRLCVVTKVEEDFIEVVYGQGTPDCARDIEIRPQSIDGDRFGVTKPTYFRCMNVTMVRRKLFPKKRVCVCSLLRFIDFEELASKARLSRSVTVQSSTAP